MKPLHETTFGDFAREATKRNFGPDDVLDYIKNGDSLAERRALARRLFSPQYRDVGLPYRTLLKLYAGWRHQRRKVQGDGFCRAGCGRQISPARRRASYCSDLCRQRSRRQGQGRG